MTGGFGAVPEELYRSRRAVLHLVLSALLEDQFEKVIDDFQKFLSTIEPESAR